MALPDHTNHHQAALQPAATGPAPKQPPPTATASAPDQVAAVQGLLERLLPEHSHLFRLHLQSAEHPCPEGHTHCEADGAFFTASTDGATITVTGTSGVELASGVHWWLKYRANSSLSWDTTGGPQVAAASFTPESLAQQSGLPPLTRRRAVPWQYYQNAVTTSYSMTWWDWERWEREIDWMALQGVNLPLAFNGQEWVWQRVFAHYGLAPEELADFFAGPSFLAWQRMGNLQGWGGPLPQDFIDRQAELQKRIVARMRAFGMTPVFPAFSGFLPEAFARHVPAARTSRLAPWAGMPPPFCCITLLDPLDPLFVDIGQRFVRELRAAFGEDAVPVYAADTFNENVPTSADPAYLSSISAAVYKAMAAGDAQATWLMQGWLFYNEAHFWHEAQIKALISGVPAGRLVILDLAAETAPQWRRTHAFFGAPFIWCMLLNYGGSNSMYGTAQAVAQGPAEAGSAPGANLIGLGVTPEGIDNNPVMYELALELTWHRQPPPLLDWIQAYAQRRYAGRAPDSALEAWHILLQTVYNCSDGHIDHVLDIPVSRPGFSPAEGRGWGLAPHLWYDPAAVAHAWRRLLDAGGALAGCSSYQFDLVDVGRQVLSKLATGLWLEVGQAYQARDGASLAAAGRRLLDLLTDLDTLLATHRGFLLGPRLEAARAAAASEADAALYEWNARTQLTVWGAGPGGASYVEDYANKEWAGLMADYYRPRWELWLRRLAADLEGGRQYDAPAWEAERLAFTAAWARRRDRFAVDPVGDALAVSRALYDKYHGLVGAPLVAAA